MHRQLGLTLLEVLVALVILAIALTAVIKATQENIQGATHLQAKTQGLWVGLYVMNQARLGLQEWPQAPEHRDGEEFMLNQHWAWEGSLKKTANKAIREIQVRVFYPANHHLAAELTSYVYRA